MSWEDQLWTELDNLSHTDQIVATGEMINRLSTALLPALAQRRRDRVLDLLEQPEWDATKIAETIGARRGTIVRLAQEGRAARRETHG